MSLIYVKTKEGRRAFSDAALKNEIPTDRYVGVRMTPIIHELLYVHEDIEQRPETEAPPPSPAPTGKGKSGSLPVSFPASTDSAS